MATATKKAPAKRQTATRTAAAKPAAKPAAKSASTKAAAKPAPPVQEVTFGASDLAALLSERTGKDVTTRELRTLLRKMARDGRINREIVPGNRTRYDWSGPEDPEVQAVIEAFEGGELEADKKEKLAALKERKAAQTAAKKAAAVPADEDEELVEDEDEELDIEDDET